MPRPQTSAFFVHCLESLFAVALNRQLQRPAPRHKKLAAKTGRACSSKGTRFIQLPAIEV